MYFFLIQQILNIFLCKYTLFIELLLSCVSKMTSMKLKLAFWELACLFLCLFCTNGQTLLAQNTKDVLPNTVAIKYKSGLNKNLAVNNKLYRATQILSPETQASLGILTHLPMFEANSPVMQASNSPKWGENCKQLGLIYVLTLSPERDLNAAIKALRAMAMIVYAEPIYTNYETLYVPNDPQANPSTNPAAYHLKTVKAYEAWDIQQGNANVVIGITDNGFNLALADLNGQDLAPAGVNRDVADGDNIVSGGSHGTHVATVAVGKANNGVGSAGTCFGCKFFPVKVAPNSNTNSYTNGYQGILLAAAQTNCKVVNMSWGRKGTPSLFEQDFLETTVADFDVVLVAAAGNDGNTATPTNLFFPASYNSVVLSVAATNNTDTKADFSTYNAYVDLCAPGANIVAQSGTDSGTSFASPIVAGAVALVRAQFPLLTAAQVRARMVATTDNIYSIAGNTAFVGGLGSGRLNMQRALSDPMIAINLQSYAFTNAKRNYLFKGMTSDLIGTFKNHLNDITNLQVTLTTNSPHLVILDGTATVGAIAANATATNSTDALKIRVSDNVTANTLATLVFTYQEGAFTFSESVLVMLNPGHADNNQISLAHDDDGTLGVYNQFSTVINGFQWQKETLFTEAGLILATNSTKVSNTVRSDVGLFDNTFTINSTNNEVTNGTLLTTTARYEDITNNVDRIGLNIEQNSYSWNETAVDKSLVLEYKIKNVAGGSIDNLYAGIFTNWDIGDNTKNLGDWDADNVLGYVRESAVNGWYAGITCLTERDVSLSAQKIHYYAFDNAISTINIADGFTKQEKFDAISKGIAKPQAGTAQGNDVANLLGVRLSNFLLGQSRTVAFAYVVGENLNDLKTQAIAIRARYKTAKTSPTPSVTNVNICQNGQIIVAPTGGSKFNFYVEEPISETTPILHTGSSLVLNNITINQTIWVTCMDSVFASIAVPLQVVVSPHKTTFTQPNDSLNLAATDQMIFTATATGATVWKWSITKTGGVANADIIFIGGTSATTANPTVKFTKHGTYTLKLVSQTAQSCKDSTTSSIVIYSDFTTAIPEILRQNTQIYPNPAQDFCQIKIANVQDNISLQLLNTQGQIMQKASYQNEPEKPYKLSLQGIPAGLYFIKIQLKQGVWTEKIIVEKP